MAFIPEDQGAISKSANVNLGRADNAFTGAYALQPIYNATGGFPYGNMGGFSAGNIFTDPNIEPEFVNSREISLEVGFLKNRINLDVTYFNAEEYQPDPRSSTVTRNRLYFIC